MEDPQLMESEMLELKKSTSELKEAVISIVSILNKHNEGTLYFGIKNDGTVNGQNVGEKTIRDISRSISEHIEPKIYPEINPVILKNKNCIKIEFKGMEVPYLAFGRAYIRVGDEDRQLSAKELENMILEKNKDKFRWETQISDCAAEKINIFEIKEFVKQANLSGRIDFAFEDVEITLKKLNLLNNGKILNAARALFCDENSLEVQAAVFAGKDKLTFLDIKQFKGSIFDLLEKSEEYIREHINWRVEIGRLERKEIPEVPIAAVREALVNSFCHRDYFAPESNKIAVFKNRIEIYNPGEFPEGFTPEDYIEGKGQSVLRNPLIADVLYKAKKIEKWGSGLKRIYDECRDKGVKLEFKKLKRGFMVVFYRREAEGQEKLGEKLGENQIKILEQIIENKHISAKELSEKIGISTTAVENNISKLKKKGFLKRIGPAKGGYWEITEGVGEK